MVIDLWRKITQKMERCGRRGLKYDQEERKEKKGNGQGPSVMEEDFIGIAFIFYWKRRCTANCGS